MTSTAGSTHAGRVREQNEDRWLVREERGIALLAVADGVGGEEGGELASAAAVDALATRFFEAVREQGARGALTAAIRGANDAVLAVQRDQAPRAATTLVAAAVGRREAAIANVGDSRAYLVRAQAARQVTTDHSGALANQVTRVIGESGGVQPDVFVEVLRGGDRIVLCSDGLTRHVSDAEIASRAARGEPSRAAAELVALANDRGGEDNITVVIYRAGGRVSLRGAVATTLLALLLVIGVVGAAAAVLLRPAP